MNRKDRLKDIFEDTVAFYTKDPDLARNVIDAKAGTSLYEENDYPQIQRKANKPGQIAVTKAKTFKAAIALAKKHPGKKIAVLNFASATNPGGGVKKGSSAQEECLCCCSILYPSLTQDWIWRRFYQKNREMRNNLHTDACIYTPQVTICKGKSPFEFFAAEEASPDDEDIVKHVCVYCRVPADDPVQIEVSQPSRPKRSTELEDQRRVWGLHVKLG